MLRTRRQEQLWVYLRMLTVGTVVSNLDASSYMNNMAMPVRAVRRDLLVRA